MTDKLNRQGTDGGDWWVSLSTGTSFGDEFLWATGQGVGSDGHFLGDLNGDARADKINYYKTSGDWWVALSNGNSFSSIETLWCHGQGTEVPAVYLGDFNGDNLCDRTSFITNGDWWVGLNTYQYPNEKIVATWFTLSYTEESGWWNKDKRDSLKIPVVGWESTQTGIYNSQDSSILNKQIDAMIKTGINLIIVDHTNGWPKISFGNDPFAYAGTEVLFQVMKNRPLDKQIKIAIAIGLEF